LIVVFPGDQKQIKARDVSVEQSEAVHLSAVKSTHEQLEKMTIGGNGTSKVQMIKSCKGVSTFEDVYDTEEITSRYRYQSVIVTFSLWTQQLA
jgi:hypothetical protein